MSVASILKCDITRNEEGALLGHAAKTIACHKSCIRRPRAKQPTR